MFRHIVLFRWVPEATRAQIDTALAALGTLPGRIPEIREFAVAEDARVSEGTFDVGVVAAFDDAEAYRRYAGNEAHVSVVAEHVRPILAERAALQGTFAEG